VPGLGIGRCREQLVLMLVHARDVVAAEAADALAAARNMTNLTTGPVAAPP
jgi:hypothetical protein